jgi:hypothetical protein
MRRMLWITVIAFASLSAGIFFARHEGRQRTLPLSALFTSPDGTPCNCLFGIRPGKTTLDEALRIVSTHPLARQLFRSRDDTVRGSTVYDGPNYQFEVVQVLSSPKVIWVILTDIGGGVVTMGDFVSALGPPEGVYPVANYSTYGVFYTQSYIKILGARGRNGAVSPISARDNVITINAYAPDVFPGVMQSYGGLLRSWRGFMVVRRYETLPRLMLDSR